MPKLAWHPIASFAPRVRRRLVILLLLATLPSLDALRGKIIGLLQAPATKIAGVLAAPAGQVARVIGAYGAKGDGAKAA